MGSKRARLVGVLVCTLMLLCNVAVYAQEQEEDEVEVEYVLTLDHTNFTETVSGHDFIVVEFYAPWCGHCKKLAPEYEEAARVLSSNEPPLILAKVDGSAEENREFATKYEVQGFPTIKILRNGGKDIQEYKGPREAQGIISYLKKQMGPASVEIKTSEDVKSIIDESKITVVGIFPEFAGEEFDNFTILANKMRSDYDFCHTLDAKLLPRGDSSLKKPTLRLLKPFDELFVDVQDFHVDSMEKFIEEVSVPLVTVYDMDPNNLPFVMKFFRIEAAKAMLIVNFSEDNLDALKSSYKDIATASKGQGVSFLVGQVETCKNILEYFGLKEDQVPIFAILSSDNKKYYKTNLKPEDISSWFKEYMDGNLKPIVKSEPIPEVNDEPVKVVVGKSITNMVLESGKNVLLEFYAPWCGHCQKLAPILDEVALSFQNDPEVLIAKLDATANDFPTETFEVQGFPTMYFKTSKGMLLQYDGDRTKEDIIEFIEKFRDESAKPATEESNEASKPATEESNAVKDEL